MSWNCENCFQGVSDDLTACGSCGFHKKKGHPARPLFSQQQSGTLNASDKPQRREDRRRPSQQQDGTLNANQGENEQAPEKNDQGGQG